MNKDEIIHEIETRLESLKRDLKTNYYDDVEQSRYFDGYYFRIESEIVYLSGFLSMIKGK